MLNCFHKEVGARPIHLVRASDYQTWLASQPEAIRVWLTSTQFKAEPGNFSLIAGGDGQFNQVICCLSDDEIFWEVGHLPLSLPEGDYTLVTKDVSSVPYALAWGLGAYQFTLYKKPRREPARLFVPETDRETVDTLLPAIYLVRDLINMPAEALGPTELAKQASDLATAFGAHYSHLVGSELEKNYAAIYTVGRAADDAPRLIDIKWGNPQHPKVTLVGKGVCFDTGGLDLKTSQYMLLMKKDMGGAAHVLGLARMIMQAQLPIRLRVLIPAVENSVAGNAYRPGDVITTRKGLTVEVTNTDAEGRLVLADALTEAVSESPALLIDMATLTGAARVALGTELPGFFANEDALAKALIAHGLQQQDPVWRLPLFKGYRDALKSAIADLSNCSSEGYGGAIHAALFLQAFVPDHIPWLHFDMMAWNLRTRPGRPEGGEAVGIRALFSYLSERYPAQA